MRSGHLVRLVGLSCSMVLFNVLFIVSCLSYVFSAGALLFGCTVALCFLIRDLMFYVIGESDVGYLCCLALPMWVFTCSILQPRKCFVTC